MAMLVNLQQENRGIFNFDESPREKFQVYADMVILGSFFFTYFLNYSSQKFHTLRKKRLNGLMRLSGLVDYMDV